MHESFRWPQRNPNGDKRPLFYRLNEALSILSISLMLSSLWIITRPYFGIVGDARFYALQGLSRLNPIAFRGDLFLAGGTKAPFSVYEFGYTPILQILGLENTNLVLLIFGSLLWFSGLLFVARNQARSELILIWSLALAIVLPNNLGFFSAGEPIVTPRIFSEAFTLFGVALVLRGQLFPATGFLGFAFAIHPLMAVPGFFLLLAYESKRLPVALVLSSILTLISAMFIFKWRVAAVPWLQPFDGVWLEELRVRESSDFVSRWSLETWLPLFNTAILAGTCISALNTRQQRFLIITACIALFGFLAAFVGGDLLHIVLIFDLQLWRSAWLFLVVTNLLIAQAAIDPVRKVAWTRTVKSLFFLALMCTVLSRFDAVFLLISVPSALLILIFQLLDFSSLREVFILKRLLLIIFSFLFSVLLILTLQSWLQSMRCLALQFDFDFIGIVLISLCFFGLFLLTNARQSWVLFDHYSIFVLAFSLLILAGAGSIWDQRTAWTKYIDNSSSAPTSLNTLLPHNEAIYWEGDVTVPWFLLRQASYFSCDQGAAILFARSDAILYGARYKDFSKLHSIDFGVGSYCPEIHKDATANSEGTISTKVAELPDMNSIVALCTQETGLGAVVLLHEVDKGFAKIWHSPVPFSYLLTSEKPQKIHYVDTFYIYRCSS